MSARRIALAAALAITTTAGAASAQGDGDELPGKAVYIEKCAPCHGDTGKADGPASETMFPRPRVFADNANYKFRTTANGELPTREDLFQVITRGVPGTSMRHFGHLPEQTRWNLVDYIESLAEDFVDPDNQEGRVAMEIGKPPKITDELIARGREVYDEQKCYECHGEDGRGDWPDWNAKVDAWNDPIIPANLTRWDRLRGGDTLVDLYRAVLTGFNGTSMPNWPMSDEERWALAAWLKSIQRRRTETQDQVVVAKRAETVPTTIDDEQWANLPRVMFPLVGQVVEKPRLFWPSVTEIFVQAAYDDENIVLLLQWDDRDKSEGTNLTEFPPEADPIYEIFVKSDFPDQVAVQFPTGAHSGSEKPYFLWGDKARAVNLWWWSSVDDKLRERNASGEAPADQDEGSQALEGTVTYSKGRYTMLVRRSLTTPDPRDVQFAEGGFVPIAFNAWQGTRGEVGKRRAISTWYLLVLEPPTPQKAYVLPFIAAGLALMVLLFIVIRVFRAEGLDAPPVFAKLFPVVTVAAVGALVVYTTVPGLYGFFTNTVQKDETAAAASGKDLERKALDRSQESAFSTYRWTDDKKTVVKLPIDRAIDQVIDDAKTGDAASLVPAVGPSTKGTMPAVVPE